MCPASSGDDPIQVGIIGNGYATRTFHAPLLRAVPGLALTAICTRAPNAVHAAWPQVATVATPQELLARPELSLIVIATPNQTHAPLAELALRAGKHVVVDKPFTVTVEEASGLVALARARGLVLSVFHNRRWDADFLTVRRVLGQGPLGRVVHVELHFDRHRPLVRPRWRELAGPGAGLWYDLGPHLLDQAVQLFGLPRALWLDTAHQRDGAQADDWFHAVLRYDTLRVVLHSALVAAQPAPRFVVHGLRGTLVKHGVDPQEQALREGRLPGEPGWGVDPEPFTLTSWDDEAASQRPDARATVQPLRGEPGDYRAYYVALREALRGRGPAPVPAEDGLAVMRLLELGLRSAQQRRELESELELVPELATQDSSRPVSRQ